MSAFVTGLVCGALLIIVLLVLVIWRAATDRSVSPLAQREQRSADWREERSWERAAWRMTRRCAVRSWEAELIHGDREDWE